MLAKADADLIASAPAMDAFVREVIEHAENFMHSDTYSRGYRDACRHVLTMAQQHGLTK